MPSSQHTCAIQDAAAPNTLGRGQRSLLAVYGEFAIDGAAEGFAHIAWSTTGRQQRKGGAALLPMPQGRGLRAAILMKRGGIIATVIFALLALSIGFGGMT